MANDITVTNNTSTNIWETKYTVDAAGTKEKTLATAGTFLDRNIKISITTPTGSASNSGGALSLTSSQSFTPAVSVSLTAQNTTGIALTTSTPSSGYYVTLKGASTSGTKTFTATRAALTLTKTSGYIDGGTTTAAATSTTSTATISSATSTAYLTIPAATFATSNNNVYVSQAGYVPAGSSSSPIGTITTTQHFAGGSVTSAGVVTPSVAVTSALNFGFTTSQPSGTDGTDYLKVDPNATVTNNFVVTPQSIVTTAGYVTSGTTTNGTGGTAITISGSPTIAAGDNYYVPVVKSITVTPGTVTASINPLSIDKSITTLTDTTSNYWIDITASGSYSVSSAKYTNTAGVIKANTNAVASNTSIASTPLNNSTAKLYIPAATLSVSGGGLTSGNGVASLDSSAGYYNGSSYDTADTVALTTAKAAGYYELTAYGSGSVTRAAISGSITTGYTTATTTSISSTSKSSNTGTKKYYIKKSASTSTTITASTATSTATIEAGYYPTARTVTVTGMAVSTVTPGYANTGMSTYFTTTASGGNVTITPNYTASPAGYVAAATNSTANSTTARWKIKTTSLTQGTTTVANNVATRGSASIATSGWIESTAIPAATFSNVATSGTTYVNISNTPDAPILDAEGNLYINKGYVDNLQISLARLIPDDANVASSATMLQGTTAYDKNGKLWTGTIATFTPNAKYYATTSDQTISTNGKYVSGNIVISKLTSSNYTAANIRKGATISVNNGNGNVYSVAGTFTSASTVSTGQTAATSGQILNGYSAWVDGIEVKGNIAAKTTGNITETFTSSSGLVNIPAGFYAEDSSFVLTNGDYTADSANSTNSTITPSVSISSASTYGFTTSTPTGTYVTIDPNATATNWSITPRANIITSGYLPEGSKNGTVVSGSPAVLAGINYYVPVVTPQFKGGGYTTNTNTNVITANPTITIESTGTFVGNGSTYGITTAAPTGTDGTNYLTLSDVVTSTTGTAQSTWQVTKAANTYSATYKGVVNISSGATAIAASTASGTSSITIIPTVTNDFVTYYVPIVTPVFTGGGQTTETNTNTVTNPTVTVNTSGSLITSASTYGVTTAAISGTEGTNFVTFDATTTSTTGKAVSSWSVTKGAVTYSGAYKGLINVASGTTAIATSTATGTKTTTITPTVTDNFPKYYIPIVTPTISGGAPSVNISSNTVTSANMSTASTGTYYITMTAKGTGSRGAITYSNSAGIITAHSDASGLNSATSNEGSKAGTVYVPTATKTLSLNSNTSGTAAMGATGFTPASSGNYYVTLTTTAGSVVPKLVTTSGYTPAETTTGSSTSVGVTGNGAQIFIPTNTITGSVVNLSSGSVAVSKTVTGMATSTTATSYYITVGATVTNGSVKGKATAGNTTGIVAAGASNTSNASTITPGVSGTGTIYIPAGAYSVSGGGLTSGTGYASLASTDVTLTTASTTGYYKVTASGYGTVNRAAIMKQVTTSGYMPADTASSYSAATSLNSNTGTKDYYIKNSTLSATSVNSSSTTSTVTITSGYYPSDRTVTINAIATGSVTPGFNQANITTYFNTTSTSTGSISITPKYTNTAGYIAAHNNTTGTTTYYNIKTTTIAQGTTTVSGTTATRGTANIASSGWITAQTIPAATFANTATSGITYVDISATTDAPILTSSGYLYINKGYTDNLRISLARLIPDTANVNNSAQMLNGVTAYDKDGVLWTGNIPSYTNSNLTVSGKTVTGPAGYYSSAISKSVADGGYTATVSALTSGNVTYSVSVTSAADYGFTTATPSGTYLTVAPGATVTTGQATAKATITTAGYLATGNKTSSLTVTPGTTNGGNYYVPVVTPTFSGGAVTATINSNTISVSGMTTTSTATSYYIDATAAGTYSRTAVTYSNSPGVIASHNGASASAAIGSTNMSNKSATRVYIPAAGITYSGGGLSATTNYTGTPTVTLASNSSSNMTNITIGAQDTTNYPYYFQVKGSTAKITGTTTVTRAAYNDTRTSGYLPGRASTTVLASTTCSPSVTVNSAEATTYVSLKKATMTVAKSTGTISASASMAGTNATLSDTNNGIKIVATGGGSASLTATATTNVAGYAPASTQLGSASLSIANTTTTQTKYISGVKLEAPSSGTRSFTITVPNGNTTDFISFIFTVDSSGNVTVDGG